MDEVFKALADPNRRRLLDSLRERNGQSLRELSAGLAMTRQAVSKHLIVLEGANIVTTVRRGREKLHYLNAAPINAIADRWMSKYDRERAHALADLKSALEHPAMSDAFVYTTYIRTTAEKLWAALIEPAFTKRYWGVEFESDWKPGSPIAWTQLGVRIDDPEQVVLESDPPRRLSYTWHTFTREFAESVGLPDEAFAKASSEKRSTVTFEIEALGDLVKLPVIHDGFDPGSTVLASISEGWPAIVASLKTLLETGEPMPDPEG